MLPIPPETLHYDNFSEIQLHDMQGKCMTQKRRHMFNGQPHVLMLLVCENIFSKTDFGEICGELDMELPLPLNLADRNVLRSFKYNTGHTAASRQEITVGLAPK